MILGRFLTSGIFVAVLMFVTLKAASGIQDDHAPDLNSLSVDDLKAITIHLERTRCYGTCPAYAVTIKNGGEVEYIGQSSVKQNGRQEGRIDLASIKALTSEFAKANYFSLSEDYSDGTCTRICTDMPTAITELNVKGIVHRVKHYYGCGGAPKVLFDLESAIDKSVNSQQWTGEVSKQGPFGTTCMNR